MKIKAGLDKDYLEFKRLSSTDDYGARIVSYSEHWAYLMEAAISQGRRLEDIALETSREADSDGITGYMYGAAVGALARFWEHGEALRHWSNLRVQIGNEGELANRTGGVLNPALVSIK